MPSTPAEKHPSSNKHTASSKTNQNGGNGTSSAALATETDDVVMKVPVQKLPDMVQELTETLKNIDTSPSAAGDRTRCLRQRAQCHFRLHDNSAALADAEAALAENRQDLDSYIVAGQASTALGQFKEAFQFYKAGLQIDPNSKILSEQLRQLQTRIMQMSECATEGEPTYNALDFCTQDPYPGDDVQLKLEQEILLSKYRVADNVPKEQEGKKINAAEGVKCLKLAYESITTGHYQDAIMHSSRALKADPTNIFCRKFRAQLLFEHNEMVESLKELWAIPKVNRTPDVWNLGGKILLTMWLPVTAEFWLRKATVMSGKKDEEAAVLFQKIRVKRLYDPLTEDFPVCVDFTQYGRTVVATEDVKAGEVLLKDLPLVHAQTLASRYVPACSHCARSLISASDYFGDNYAIFSENVRGVVDHHWPDVTPVWCPKCEREKYCCQLCLEDAWENNHQILCPSVNQAAVKLYELHDKNGYGENEEGHWVELWGGHYSPFVLAKMWAAILCHVKRLMKEAGNEGGQPTVEQWATAKAPYRRFIAFGTTPATERMPEMLKVFQEVFGSSLQGLQYPITEAEFKGRYYQAACNLQCFSAAFNPFHRFLNSLQDDVGAFTILKYLDETKIPEAYFAGMFPVHACLNHACDNNAEVSNGELDGHFGVQVTAKRDIKKGEEIFITYIDTALPRMLRRAWLFKSFNFWCSCRRCRFEGDQPTVCTQCNAKSEPNKKFPTCGNCHKAWYCSSKCQRQAWTQGHKIICQTKHSLVANPEDYDVC